MSFGNRAVAMLAMMCLTATPAWSQAGPVRATLGGRLHYQWNSTSVDQAETGGGAPIATSTFEQRRVRMTVDVAVGDWMSGRIEPEFTMGRLGVRQAWVAFELDSLLVLRAGQVKKPFGLVFLTSSGALPVIERGVRIRGLDDALRLAGPAVHSEVRGALLAGEHFTLLDAQRYAGYDMGLTVEGRRGSVAWTAGVYNGTGADQRAEGDDVSSAARVSWQPPVGAALTLGGAWSRRSMNWPAAGSTETRTGNAFAVDAELGGFRRGLWMIGEVARGENLATGESFTAAQAIAAYFRPTGGTRVEGWEPAARVSWGDPDGAVTGDDGLLLTPGFNVYFAGRNRLMLNWDVYLPAGDGVATQHGARAQVNLHF
ncbi:MAG TPA: porin [Longimicrobiales bacterium]|nr:porin [Longimicrobiales bacterium]